MPIAGFIGTQQENAKAAADISSEICMARTCQV
jgi:hypothetical protein